MTSPSHDQSRAKFFRQSGWLMIANIAALEAVMRSTASGRAEPVAG